MSWVEFGSEVRRWSGWVGLGMTVRDRVEQGVEVWGGAGDGGGNGLELGEETEL